MTATATPPSQRPMRGAARKRLRVVLFLAALLFAAGAAFVWWFLRDDAPDEVSISAAAAQVIESAQSARASSTGTAPVAPAAGASTAAAATATTAAATAGDVSGTWNVDTTIGDFNYEDSTGTFVGFRIAEELQGIGSTEAVGRTPTVSGTITIDDTTLTKVTVEADMSAITTNDSRRDDKVWQALETSTYPTGTFVLTEPVDLGAAATTGEPVQVQATGELTIHGVTQTVTIPLEAQLVGDTIAVVGQLDVVFADYSVTVPTAPIVLSVDDQGVVELQLFFTR